MTIDELKEIVSQVELSVGCINWDVFVGITGGAYYLQLRYVEPDIETGNPEGQHGRKWYVSSHSTKSEIVQTLLKAALTSAEHMVREHFTYRGRRIFGPHFSVDDPVKLIDDEKLGADIRPKETAQ